VIANASKLSKLADKQPSCDSSWEEIMKHLLLGLENSVYTRIDITFEVYLWGFNVSKTKMTKQQSVPSFAHGDHASSVAVGSASSSSLTGNTGCPSKRYKVDL